MLHLNHRYVTVALGENPNLNFERKIKFSKVAYYSRLHRYRAVCCLGYKVRIRRLRVEVQSKSKDCPTQVWTWGILTFYGEPAARYLLISIERKMGSLRTSKLHQLESIGNTRTISIMSVSQSPGRWVVASHEMSKSLNLPYLYYTSIRYFSIFRSYTPFPPLFLPQFDKSSSYY